MPADLLANAFDETRVAVDDRTDTAISGLQAVSVLDRDDDGMATPCSTGTSSRCGMQSHMGNEAVRDKTSSKGQTRDSRRAAKKKKKASKSRDVQNEDRTGNENTIDADTTPRPPPLSRSATSFANATKASLAWQTEKHELSPSSKSPWTPAGSPASSRPVSANTNVSAALSHTSSQSSQGSRRVASYRSYPCKAERKPSFVSEPTLQQSETQSESNELVECQPMVTGLGEADVEPPYELGERPVDGSLEGANLAEYEEHIDVESLRIDNSATDADLPYPWAALNDLRAQNDQFRTAWLETCAAMSVSAEAVEDFQPLVTDAEVDDSSRDAVYEALTPNGIRRWVNSTEKKVEDLRLELKTRDERISALEAELVSYHGDDVDGQQSPIDWRLLYEGECRRFESLDTQHKRLQIEAERMYQPDLEKKYKELQVQLIAVKDTTTDMADEIRKTRDQAQTWRDEAELRKEELAKCTAQFEEQSQLQNEEMVRSIKEYRDKVKENRYWDKDSLLSINEQLEREKAVLAREVERLLRTNVDKDDQMRTLLETQHQEERAWLAHGTTVSQAEQMVSKQEEIQKLREMQRKRKEEEDAEERLKDKVRQLRMGNRADQTAWEDLLRRPWWKRWAVDESSALFSVGERARIVRLKTAE